MAIPMKNRSSTSVDTTEGRTRTELIALAALGVILLIALIVFVF